MRTAPGSRWRWRTGGLAVLSSFLLSGCGAPDERQAGPSPQEAPSVAPSMPSAIADPAATEALRSFEGRDTDRDGFVSSVESAAAEAQIFRAIDADQDGSVSPQELDAARLALGLVTLPGSEEVIAQADQDRDGKLTLAEWIAHEGAAFRKADADKDGRLDRREFDAQPRLKKAAPGTSAGTAAPVDTDIPGASAGAG